MKKLTELARKLIKGNVVTALALVVIAVSEMSTMACTIWIFGQDDMPDELI